MAAAKKPATAGDVKASSKKDDGYTKVKSPSGAETTVPDSIVERLLESGYKRA